MDLGNSAIKDRPTTEFSNKGGMTLERIIENVPVEEKLGNGSVR